MDQSASWAALSRSYMTIKNNTDEEIDFDFFYEDRRQLAVRGIRSDHPRALASKPQSTTCC